MNNPDEGMVYGWRHAAEVAGCSERYLRDLAAERDLIADRRADGAVGLRRHDLLALAEELRRDRRDAPEQHRPDGSLPAPTAAAQLGEHGAPAPTGPATASPATVVAARPDDTAVRNAAGEIAALVFGDLSEGRELTWIVSERKLMPDVVQGLYQRWRELRALDDLHAEAAEDRIGKLETTVREQRQALDLLRGGLGSAWEQLTQLGTAVAQLQTDTRRLSARLAAAEKRASNWNLTGSMLDLAGRLAAVESIARAWSPSPPMPPMLPPRGY